MRGERPAWLGGVAIHGGLPLLVGGLVYLLARPRSLLMFDWFEAIGLGPALELGRELAGPWVAALPGPVVFSLPNALWTYAFTATMLRLWGGRLDAHSGFWIAFGPLLALGWELGQLFSIVPGRFDVIDLAFIVAASLLALFGLPRPKGEQEAVA